MGTVDIVPEDTAAPLNTAVEEHIQNRNSGNEFLSINLGIDRVGEVLKYYLHSIFCKFFTVKILY